MSTLRLAALSSSSSVGSRMRRHQFRWMAAVAWIYVVILSPLVDQSQFFSWWKTDYYRDASVWLLNATSPLMSDLQHVSAGYAVAVGNASASSPIVPHSLPTTRKVYDPVTPHGAPFEFSSCLLMRDDNKILPEWLAYHYEVLPLRRLIVALDPFSVTDPTPILDAYRALGMYITVWTDDDYMYNGTKSWERPFYGTNLSKAEMAKGYLWRQRAFLVSCSRQLRLENRTWTTFLDTDEYLVFNHYRPTEGVPFDCTRREAPPNCSESYHAEMQMGQALRTRLPRYPRSADGINNRIAPTKTVAHVLAEFWDELLAWDPSYGRFCWVLPRSLFGAWDAAVVCNRTNDGCSNASSTPEPEGDNDSDAVSIAAFRQFRSLRFRHTHALQTFLPGKPIVDVSRSPQPWDDISNPHRPHPECRQGPYVRHSASLLRVNHYTGTQEEFLTRPGRELYQFLDRNDPSGVLWREDLDEHVGWWHAFVRHVGMDRARDVTMELRQWAWDSDAEAFRKLTSP